jgi:hypothetical protein
VRAITLWQPWGSAIFCCGKPIENRDWPPPRWIIGEPLAIHAGKFYDVDGAAFGWPPDAPPIPRRGSVPHGSVIGVVRVTGATYHPRKPAEQLALGPSREVLALSPEQRRWLVGDYGWHLVDVRPFAVPVKCRGGQKIWILPGDVEAEVVRQLAAVAAGAAAPFALEPTA